MRGMKMRGSQHNEGCVGAGQSTHLDSNKEQQQEEQQKQQEE